LFPLLRTRDRARDRPPCRCTEILHGVGGGQPWSINARMLVDIRGTRTALSRGIDHVAAEKHVETLREEERAVGLGASGIRLISGPRSLAKTRSFDSCREL
jgi:hypothetical protein